MRKKEIQLLGISFVEETQEDILQKVKMVWTQGEKFRIATVNPEFLVEAHADKNFRENLRLAQVRIVDGFGLWLAVGFSGLATGRIAGVALTKKLLDLAEAEQKKVVIILPQSGLSSSTLVREVFGKKYPQLASEVIVLGTGEPLPKNTTADLFLVALGAPEQEYMSQEISSGVTLGVGGAIDFLTAAQKRAPKFMQSLGLEWLYRLFQQPARFRRIIRAIIIFPLIFISERILNICKIRLVQ